MGQGSLPNSQTNHFKLHPPIRAIQRSAGPLVLRLSTGALAAFYICYLTELTDLKPFNKSPGQQDKGRMECKP
jgi:hypothetical protein